MGCCGQSAEPPGGLRPQAGGAGGGVALGLEPATVRRVILPTWFWVGFTEGLLESGPSPPAAAPWAALSPGGPAPRPGGIPSHSHQSRGSQGKVTTPDPFAGCKSCERRAPRVPAPETYLLVGGYCVSWPGRRRGEGRLQSPRWPWTWPISRRASYRRGRPVPLTPSAITTVLHGGQAPCSVQPYGRGAGPGRSWPWGSDRALWGPEGVSGTPA